MNYFNLAKTTPDVLEKIEAAERKGLFSEHLDPIDYNNCNPVDENYHYIWNGRERCKYALLNFFIVRPYSWIVNQFILKTCVKGQENLRGLPAAVVTCNHVNKLDAVAVKHAFGGRKMKIMVADFNNQKGPLGDFMRTAGTMPFSAGLGVMRNFNKAVSHYLNHKTFMLFFPERAEWWCYEKPRPYMDGAYHYALSNKVPVVPVFITFKKLGRRDRNGIERRQFVVHIMEPIYPDWTKTKKENIQTMKEQNFELCKKKYEEFYGRKLEYTCDAN